MSISTSNTFANGFQEPVFDSQRAFRTAMNALANPGRILPAGAGLASAPLPAAAAALVLALCDFETTLYLSAAIAARTGAADYLRFYSDSDLVEKPSDAAFAIIDLSLDTVDLGSFAQGTAEYPDRSTTVIAVSSNLSDGPPLLLSGPGIPKTAELRVVGLPDNFADQWRANRAGFPLGVDMLFATSDALVGLPRSSRIVGEHG